ncbi:hypothetical protein [Acinetobacter calcoaceticus]|uniref:hypothetical protein n=1 Tax=Acinetobacter calcoaceticus TaxID=471 RepID=UPI0002D116D1|nr:hypothetical protein [Acinetobacter calcoaceticus]ENU07746.1 hypothetical protein F997_03609 [Acinetobacter calcoaceticus NIPH 13]
MAHEKETPKHCSDERPCINCFADQGTCEALQAFLIELTELTYKYKIALCMTETSGDCIAAIPLSDADPDGHGPSYIEVIKGSGFIQF